MPKIFETPLYPYVRSPDQDGEEIKRHKVVIVGAGPVGLALAIDLAQADVPVLLLDENDRVSFGSRAICFAKRPLEILDRLGCGQRMVDKGVEWGDGKVFFDTREVYGFELLPEKGHQRPAFINLQQYHFEDYLLDRLRDLQSEGKPIEFRGGNKVDAIGDHENGVVVEIDTEEGPYEIMADWLVACDGATSPIRRMMGLDFTGKVFEDNFLIADVIMKAEYPSERWFWFDPPFNRGQSALLHKQPDNVWRIDFQIGWDIDREKELKPENIDKRLRAMLGKDVEYELEWSSIYTFQCRRMEQFHKGRVIFAGDAAHQVSPFGARGANSGLQDTDNLGWKLKLITEGKAPASLLDSYDAERIYAADENILNSTRSTEFITPKSEMSRIYRDAVLKLSEENEFARPFVNSGRLSVPAIYDQSPLNTPDALEGGPEDSRPGAPCPDAPLGDGYLLPALGGQFTLLAINTEAPDSVALDGIVTNRLAISTKDDTSGLIAARYLGKATSALYLIRPDQHVAARFPEYDQDQIRFALARATGKEA
ncbi:MAG: FAD-dependent oxidoreductase [Maritimibacter sp.]